MNLYNLSQEMKNAWDRYKAIYRDPNLFQGKFYIFCGPKHVWQTRWKWVLLQFSIFCLVQRQLFEKRAENEQNRHHYFSKSLFSFSNALFKYWNRWVLLRHVSWLSRGCSDKILTNTGIFWALRSSAASNQLFLQVRLFLPAWGSHWFSWLGNFLLFYQA